MPTPNLAIISVKKYVKAYGGLRLVFCLRQDEQIEYCQPTFRLRLQYWCFIGECQRIVSGYAVKIKNVFFKKQL